MEFRTFDDLIANGTSKRSMVPRMSVAVADDEHTIRACLHARQEGIADPLFVGSKDRVIKILNSLGESIPDEHIVDESDALKACEKAVSLIRCGDADFLMKGAIDTKILLKSVVNKETGLGCGGLMTHFSIFEIPAYHKLLVPVDGGMVSYPTLELKKEIIENTVQVLHRFGYDLPKVGVLACVEKVNPKMPETVEAAALAEMNKQGLISGCIVDGPVSFDCAVSKDIADLKNYKSPIAGDVDVLIAPNIHTGNVIGKLLTCFAGAKMAGFVTGATCPIILTSRGSSAEEKYYSIALAALASKVE
jgi:phosphate butyryltransferase